MRRALKRATGVYVSGMKRLYYATDSNAYIHARTLEKYAFSQTSAEGSVHGAPYLICNMSGYSLAPIDRSRIDKTNLCPKCEGLLREAVQTIACGHRYCKSCVLAILSQGDAKCVIDGSMIIQEQVFLDRFVEREIQSLLVHCVNYEHGCEWKDELRKREAHDALCEYVQVPCVHSECGELVSRANLAEHLEKTCQYRTEKCEHCKSTVTFAVIKDHQETKCPAVLITCPECKRSDIPRAQLAAHMDPVNGDCEEVHASCPWTQIGCSETETMKLQERKIHEKETTAVHLMLLFRTVMQLVSVIKRNMSEANHVSTNGITLPPQNELDRFAKQVENLLKENGDLKSQLAQQQERIKRLESAKQQISLSSSASSPDTVTFKELAWRMDKEEVKIADLELLLTEESKSSEDLQRQVCNLARGQEASNATINKLQRQFEVMSHSLALRNVMMSDLDEHTKQQQQSSCDGILVWKISDFARRQQDAVSGKETSFYSPCFFTGRYGYKMCARIYLNGDGIGKGTHISVFFAVMRGEYDALLRWPFRQKVTFMLLDQNNVEHVIDAFRPDPNSSSFQRPRRESNIPSGCPTFCPLSELRNHAYVRDDAMFLKVIVDTTDL